MSIETIHYEGHEVKCVPSATFGWTFFHDMNLGGPHSHCARWSRMADRKAAARECCERSDLIGRTWEGQRTVPGDCAREVATELAGLGLFLVLLSLVSS